MSRANGKFDQAAVIHTSALLLRVNSTEGRRDPLGAVLVRLLRALQGCACRSRPSQGACPAADHAKPPPLNGSVLRIDADRECRRIAQAIREQTIRKLRRRGMVVAAGGDINSSVCLALAAEAVGSQNVLALLLHEADAEPHSLRLARFCAQTFGVPAIAEDIAPMLHACGYYARRNAAIRRLIPSFADDWKWRVVPAGNPHYKTFVLTVESPNGRRSTRHLSLEPYLGIMAAERMKQRLRKQLEYYHADRLLYAVAGTANRVEHDQGFFVKNGDGAADLKPIAHLYATQVYALAATLDVPAEIRHLYRFPSPTDVSPSAAEVYFTLPFQQLDLCVWGFNHGITLYDVAKSLGVSDQHAQRLYRDIQARRRFSGSQQIQPLLVEDIPEIRHGN
jgi:NAD+ synthase